ncbi:hypothetical protein [Thermovenabulum sp.]|uniref:hypothetical protein n=1 Tax=Thermovenabulum sp. TaxID=3100335 RepID=UPI003C7BDACE
MLDTYNLQRLREYIKRWMENDAILLDTLRNEIRVLKGNIRRIVLIIAGELFFRLFCFKSAFRRKESLKKYRIINLIVKEWLVGMEILNFKFNKHLIIRKCIGGLLTNG